MSSSLFPSWRSLVFVQFILGLLLSLSCRVFWLRLSDFLVVIVGAITTISALAVRYLSVEWLTVSNYSS
jgi:uncharacterized metal-binding protein